MKVRLVRKGNDVKDADAVVVRMPRRSRFGSLACGVALLGLAMVGCSPGSPSTQTGARGEAVCEEPDAEVVEASARPGDVVHVRGSGWLPCVDSEVVYVDGSGGRSGSDDDEEEALSDWRTVDLAWVRGDHELSAPSAEPDADGSFEVAVTVPVTMTPGVATLRVSSAEFAVGLEVDVSG